MMEDRLAPARHDTIEGVPDPAETGLLFGHEEVLDAIVGAFRAGRLHHALVLAGPKGIGKATLAFAVANHILGHAQATDAPPALAPVDRSSQLFRQIAQDAHPSLLHLTRPLNEKTKAYKTALTVDEIRRVGKFLGMTAHDGGYRVVIVDAADDMNASAANALLKSLEEPPARTIFILVAHSAGALLPTIRSRCQIHRMQALAPETLLRVLEAAGMALPENAEARARLAARADGSARQAMLLTQYGGLEIAEAIGAIVEAGAFDVAAAYRLADGVSGRDQSTQFAIFNDLALKRVADAARQAADHGQTEPSSRLAETWDAVRQTIRDADTFNLDRRQHVMGTLNTLHGTLPR